MPNNERAERLMRTKQSDLDYPWLMPREPATVPPEFLWAVKRVMEVVDMRHVNDDCLNVICQVLDL